jgi:ubiquitin-like protein 4
VEKIKLLLNKKPIPASKKTVSEALEGSDVSASSEIEFGVMIMGGAPDPSPQVLGAAILSSAPESEKAGLEAQERKAGASVTPMEGVEAAAPVQPGEVSGQQILETPEFWEDLQAFLEQRIRHAEDATSLRGLFERAWRSSTSAP